MPTVLNHASSSANPATSLSSLWAYVQPALDHIVKSPSNDPNGKAPAIDYGLYAGIHSACYNYFTTQNESTAIYFALSNELRGSSKGGTDIYDQLDNYFAEAAREIALGAPLDDITLIQYLLPSFNRYHAGVQSANRLLNYINRHYVKRAIDEDRGWLRIADVLELLAKNITPEGSREVISKLLRDKKLQELKKWGYVDGESQEKMAFAEACAEAASPLDRVVPISSLALRRLRTEVIEPLLASPKIKGKSKAKHKIPKPLTSPNPALPRGRLARAVKELLDGNSVNDEERQRLASGIAKILQLTGIRNDHPLRKRLDKYLASSNWHNSSATIGATTDPHINAGTMPSSTII